jgi:hypothetical protein
VDHSDDERVLEALSADVSRTDPRWQRRWRLEQALLPARAPSWAALAASFALLMVSAALLVVMVESGQRWLLLVVAAVFALGMRPLARGTRGRPRPAATRRVKLGRLRRSEQPGGRPGDRRGF